MARGATASPPPRVPAQMRPQRRARQETARRQRRLRQVAIAGIFVAELIGAGVWLANSDASPLRTGAGSDGASLSSYRPPDLHALVVSPNDPQTITFGHHQGMLISRDGGATWRPLSGAAGKDAMGVALPPASMTALAAGHDVFMRSDDGGQTWSTVRPALPGTDIHGFTASATAPNTFYAYVVGFGLFKSSDGGVTWAAVGQPPGSTMSLAAARSGSAEVLFASTMEGMARSADGGRSWDALRDVPAGSVSAVGDIVYVADRSTVLASSDGGRTWQRRSFPRSAGLIAVAPANTDLVYVVTDRREVWRSSDAGATWAKVG
jgi:photosystem II stability/assembly factor-like uncharacterized protein